MSNQLNECGCTICGKTDEPLELSFSKTWKHRIKTGESLCECFGNRNGCIFDMVYFHNKSDILMRDKGNLHDREGDFADPYCKGCNTTFGKIHHINCDDEKCPKCSNQILTCNCNRGRGHVFLDVKGTQNDEHLNFYRERVFPGNLLDRGEQEKEIPNDDWLKQNLIYLVGIKEDSLRDENDEESREMYKEDIMMSKEILDIIYKAKDKKTICLNTNEFSWLKMHLNIHMDIYKLCLTKSTDSEQIKQIKDELEITNKYLDIMR